MVRRRTWSTTSGTRGVHGATASTAPLARITRHSRDGVDGGTGRRVGLNDAGRCTFSSRRSGRAWSDRKSHGQVFPKSCAHSQDSGRVRRACLAVQRDFITRVSFSHAVPNCRGQAVSLAGKLCLRAATGRWRPLHEVRGYESRRSGAAPSGSGVA